MQTSGFDSEDLLHVLEPGLSRGGFDYLLDRVEKCRDRQNVEAKMSEVSSRVEAPMTTP
jgi:hypothetical protein